MRAKVIGTPGPSGGGRAPAAARTARAGDAADVQYTPLTPGAAGALVVVAFTWLLLRLSLGQQLRRDPDWSRGLDGLASGGVAVAVLLVGQRVAGL